MKLFNKLLVFNLLGKGAFLLIFLMLGPYRLKYLVLENTDQELIEKKEQVLRLVNLGGIANFISDENSEEGFGSYNILKEEYILLERATSNLVIAEPISIEKRIIEDEEISYRVYAEVIDIDGESYLLEIGKSLSTIEQIEDIFFQISIGILFLFLAFSFVVDFAISKKIMAPFNRIIQKKISRINEPQEFHDQIIPSSTNEFKLLDQAISEMMKRIQKSFNQERIFISHASHELKTPISVLQSKLEAIFGDENLTEKQHEKLLEMQDSLQKMKKSVNALLLLSKVNNAQYLKTEAVDIQKVCTDLLEDWTDIAESKGVRLKSAALEPFVFNDSNSSLCSMMIQNALSNAVKYVSQKGEVVVKGVRSGERYLLSIENEGEGIDENLLAQVKNGMVFLKDISHEKSGFGLQIMHKIAVFLGVAIQIATENGKTKVIFSFPR
ncbi:MAG: HAMP domain-containing histidine kinase [Algoriphagus sp.]|jgi:signal transduction histidine kinase|nr:HAMP domain-containing histidine kinase [Algoriphagus sp.]MCE2778677.1 HAMP domain-containing histidine kinase [Algoriphagus sp.]